MPATAREEGWSAAREMGVEDVIDGERLGWDDAQQRFCWRKAS
jgi:hypothetical protein